jgi:23S rRNA pseudouridine1911/1915/1917 synthase
MSYEEEETLQDTLAVPIEETLMNNNIDTIDLEDELFEHFRFEVPKANASLRIDKYLMSLIQNATRNKIQTAATEGNIL